MEMVNNDGNSDVKLGQNVEVKVKVEARTTRSRPHVDVFLNKNTC